MTTDRFRRLTASVSADLRVRFRRTSTAVTFTVMCLLCYLIVPDPATGRALMTIDGSRVSYSSAAVAMSTAVLSAMLVGLIGFYLVSNSVMRDARARTGLIIASTRISNLEYLVSKLIGNAAFLLTLGCGLLLSTMVMYLLRGEGPLEPAVFLRYYALILIPAALSTATVALVFESLPWLAGRLGDVLYFFLWMCLLTVPVLVGARGDPGAAQVAACFDGPALSLVFQQVRSGTGSDRFTIGQTPFDPQKAPVKFQRVKIESSDLLPRFVSGLWPLPLLLLVSLRFHRFDPARLRGTQAQARRGWLSGLNGLLKPLSPVLGRILPENRQRSSARPSFVHSVRTDVFLVFATYPLVALMAATASVTALFLNLGSLSRGLLPVAFLVLIPVLSDIPCRERQQVCLPLVFAVPGLKSRFFLWKLSVSMVVALCFTSVPLARLLIAEPVAGISLAVGVVFFAAWATGLGLLSGTPKAFVIAALLFWYLVVSDQGRTAGLDFAGWFGTATNPVRLSYVALSAGLIAVTQILFRYQLRSDRWTR